MLHKLCFAAMVLGASLSATSALADDAFSVGKKKSPTLGDVTDVSITSRLDAVQVQDISINRGNCRLINSYGSPVSKPMQPFKMKFGETVKVGAAGFCNPLEVEIKTDKGTFKSGWDK